MSIKFSDLAALTHCGFLHQFERRIYTEVRMESLELITGTFLCSKKIGIIRPRARAVDLDRSAPNAVNLNFMTTEKSRRESA